MTKLKEHSREICLSPQYLLLLKLLLRRESHITRTPPPPTRVSARIQNDTVCGFPFSSFVIKLSLLGWSYLQWGKYLFSPVILPSEDITGLRIQVARSPKRDSLLQGRWVQCSRPLQILPLLNLSILHQVIWIMRSWFTWHIQMIPNNHMLIFWHNQVRRISWPRPYCNPKHPIFAQSRPLFCS